MFVCGFSRGGGGGGGGGGYCVEQCKCVWMFCVCRRGSKSVNVLICVCVLGVVVRGGLQCRYICCVCIGGVQCGYINGLHVVGVTLIQCCCVRVAGGWAVQFPGVAGQNGLQPDTAAPTLHPPSAPAPRRQPGRRPPAGRQPAGDGAANRWQRPLWWWRTDHLVMTPAATCLAGRDQAGPIAYATAALEVCDWLPASSRHGAMQLPLATLF